MMITVISSVLILLGLANSFVPNDQASGQPRWDVPAKLISPLETWDGMSFKVTQLTPWSKVCGTILTSNSRPGAGQSRETQARKGFVT